VKCSRRLLNVSTESEYVRGENLITYSSYSNPGQYVGLNLNELLIYISFLSNPSSTAFVAVSAFVTASSVDMAPASVSESSANHREHATALCLMFLEFVFEVLESKKFQAVISSIHESEKSISSTANLVQTMFLELSDQLMQLLSLASQVVSTPSTALTGTIYYSLMPMNTISFFVFYFQ